MSTLKHPFATVEFREDKIIHIHYNSLLISLDNRKNSSQLSEKTTLGSWHQFILVQKHLPIMR